MRHHWSSADWRIIIGGRPPRWGRKFAMLLATVIAIAAIVAFTLPLP
jgi:hypothetical protein